MGASNLTVDNGSYPSIDQSLEEDIPKGLMFIKVNLSNHFIKSIFIERKNFKNASVGAIGLQRRSFFQRLAFI